MSQQDTSNTILTDTDERVSRPTDAAYFVQAAIAKYTRDRQAQLEEDSHDSFGRYIEEAMRGVVKRINEVILLSAINGGHNDERSIELLSEIQAGITSVNIEQILSQSTMQILGHELSQFQTTAAELWVGMINEARDEVLGDSEESAKQFDLMREAMQRVAARATSGDA